MSHVTAGAGEVVVSMEGICKSFPGVKALDDVSFQVRSGEVMALLGENGAGKSTLVKILSGVYTRDSGKMRLFGKEYGDLTPRLAQSLGVAIIHQELNMCGHLSVAENMFLGREITTAFTLSGKTMEREARRVLSDLKIDVDPAKVVGELPVSKQQMVEIAKALLTNAKVLIMDEPTSSLTSREIEDLFRIIGELRAKGCAVIYISHRLDELKYIVDRVTIMRDGRLVTVMDYKETTLNDIISYMVGREIKEKFPRVSRERGREVFCVQGLNAGRMVRDISFTLHEGEIVGFAGLMGAGRTETTRAIFGADPKTSGRIWVDGKEVKINSVRAAIRAGVVLAPEDRKRHGLCTKLSVRQNITLPNLGRVCDFGVVRKRREDAMCRKAVSDLQIKTPGMDVDAATLSGGNQQKVVVSKWLASNSRVVMFDEPTRGIDVAAKVEMYHLMNDLKMRGIAVMFVSSEMPEVLGIADRVIVMCDGRITGEISGDQATQESVLKLATRFEDKLAAG